MPTEPLSNVDTAWLRMEGASHPMMITMAMVFGAPLNLERLKAAFEERFLPFRRFSASGCTLPRYCSPTMTFPTDSVT